MVRCPCCKQEKETEDFYKNSSRSTGISAHCKTCIINKHRERYTKEEISLKNKKSNLKSKYGLSLEIYFQMCKDQNFLCFICEKQKELVVDHCHKSGEIRKLLCRSCNTGLGCFDDNPLLFDKAKEYVSSQN